MSGGTSGRVAIVVPLSARPGLLPDEELSLRQLCHYLGAYDKFLVAPAGMPVDTPGFRARYFPRKFFGSAAAHNNLLLWPHFYRTFERYDYIFIYHLDSLVFADELRQWCDEGLDYIGAPWLPSAETPWVTEPRVGNGGFTLMKVASVLKVLRTRYAREPWRYLADMATRNAHLLQPVYRGLERAHRVTRARWIARVLAHRDRAADPGRYGINNDYFWSFRAADYLPGFRVGSVEQGLRFAFEAAPRTCFELNGRRRPFGCHAWTKFDRGFWEPYLLRGDGKAS